MKWLRCRFRAYVEDFRPVKWPPVGPYWCSGYGDDHSIVIAYVKSESQVEEYWPEASFVEVVETDNITFTDRFQKPDWWIEEQGAEVEQ